MALVVGGAVVIGAFTVGMVLSTVVVVKIRKVIVDKSEIGNFEASYSFQIINNECSMVKKMVTDIIALRCKQSVGVIGQYKMGKTYLLEKLTKAGLDPRYDIHTKGIDLITNNERVWYDTQGLFEVEDEDSFEDDRKRDEFVVKFILEKCNTLIILCNDLDRNIMGILRENSGELRDKNVLIVFNFHLSEDFKERKENFIKTKLKNGKDKVKIGDFEYLRKEFSGIKYCLSFLKKNPGKEIKRIKNYIESLDKEKYELEL